MANGLFGAQYQHRWQRQRGQRQCRAQYATLLAAPTRLTAIPALYYNTTGVGNVANGGNALYRQHTLATYNVANSVFRALCQHDWRSTTWPTAILALNVQTLLANNVANGADALIDNTDWRQATWRTARTRSYNNTTGGSNVANGANALDRKSHYR